MSPVFRPASEIVAGHAALVRSFFLRRCACPEDAEDLAQEAFLAIVEALPRFRGDSAPSTWIWTICRRVFARHIRTKVAREGALARLLVEEASIHDLAEAAAEGKYGHSDEERIALDLVLERLGPGDRLLYHCAYIRGLDIRETAKILGRPEGTIKYQLHILRTRIRELLVPKTRGVAIHPRPAEDFRSDRLEATIAE
ncbi:MAG: sigma-70 family RNA polymerase sigma factor [Treponema sp.]|nr:sigma-70 family RNA polymerase sigma factor [Treponema sp.]